MMTCICTGPEIRTSSRHGGGGFDGSFLFGVLYGVLPHYYFPELDFLSSYQRHQPTLERLVPSRGPRLYPISERSRLVS